MINRNRLKSLVEHHNDEHPIVSMYVNVDLPKKFASQLNSMVRNKVQELHEKSDYPEKETEALEKLLFQMESHVKGRKNRYPGTKVVAIFADTTGFWEEFELPLTLPNRLRVDPTAYIRPLTGVQNNFLRFCIVVSNAHRARILTFQGNQISAERDIFVEEETVGTNDEALRGFGEQHQERTEREQLHKHIKQVADAVFQIFKSEAYDYLIIGAPQDKELPLLRDTLHSYLQKKVIGEFNARPEDDKSEIEQKLQNITNEWEKKQERELLDLLSSESYEGGKATEGVGPTLKALMNGQVHTLAVKEGYARDGYICPKDHYLDLSNKDCPICGTPLVPVEDIVDEMVEETLNQNGEIRYIRHFPQELEKNGLAARLRFVI